MQYQKTVGFFLFRQASRSWPWQEQAYKQLNFTGIWGNNVKSYSQAFHNKFVYDDNQISPFHRHDRCYRIWKCKSSWRSALFNQKKANQVENKSDKRKLYSVKKKSEDEGDLSGNISTDIQQDVAEQEKEGILARFRNTYKRHGKIFIAVHLITSSMWAGSFYCMVISGIDIINVLQWMGVSSSIILKLNSPSIGHFASTYLLYKLASPLRYMVTVAGTRLTVKYLQKVGKMPVTPEENKIRSLLKEGGVDIPRARRRRNNSPQP